GASRTWPPRRNGCLADIAARCNRRLADIAAPAVTAASRTSPPPPTSVSPRHPSRHADGPSMLHPYRADDLGITVCPQLRAVSVDCGPALTAAPRAPTHTLRPRQCP